MRLMLRLSDSCIITRDGSDILVVAEIGQNHQGSLQMAKQMILEAKMAGCGAVKFQKTCLEAKFTEAALNHPYKNSNSWGSTYGEHKAFLEFSIDQFRELREFAANNDILFGASAMDEVSLNQLYRLNMDFIKIGSGDANNIPLLRRASRMECPFIISTGMQSMHSIRLLTDIMSTIPQKRDVAIMHCVSSYPTAVEDCNLEYIQLLKKENPMLVVGYSGHELGIDVSTAAVCLGARIIERHFTLNKKFKGTDHQCSLEPKEMADMIGNFRKLKSFLEEAAVNKKPMKENSYWLMEKVLGNVEHIRGALLPIKEEKTGPLPCELPCRNKLGKSVVVCRDIKCGSILNWMDLDVKVSKPQGISPEYYDSVLGSTLNTNISYGMPLLWENITEKHNKM